MADIYDWSTTAADNDDADSAINWLENQAPSTVNNSARAMMKRGKELLNDITYVGTVGGTANAITLTSGIGALASNKITSFKAASTTTSATVTLAVNGLTAKNIRKINDAGSDAALSVGDITAGKRYRVVYDAAADSAAGAWILLNPNQLSAAVADVPVVGTNTADTAGNTVARFDSNRASPANFDQAYLDVGLSDVAGTQALCYRLNVQIDDVTNGSENSSVYQAIRVADVLTYKTGLNNTGFYPYTDGGLSLGISANKWSAIYHTDGQVFPNIPQNSKSAAYTTVLADAGKHILHPTADNNARTFTIDSNANVAYPLGTTITFVNQINTVTIAITSDTMTFAGVGTTGSRTLAANGMATAMKIATTSWVISGTGLT